jgi:integrase
MKPRGELVRVTLGGRREHRVPLTDRSLAILEEMKASDYLSPATARWPAFRHNVRNSAYAAHGFRSSFRDWAGNETHYPRELAEHALLMSSAIKPNKPTVDRTHSRSGAN